MGARNEKGGLAGWASRLFGRDKSAPEQDAGKTLAAVPEQGSATDLGAQNVEMAKIGSMDATSLAASIEPADFATPNAPAFVAEAAPAQEASPLSPTVASEPAFAPEPEPVPEPLSLDEAALAAGRWDAAWFEAADPERLAATGAIDEEGSLFAAWLRGPSSLADRTARRGQAALDALARCGASRPERWMDAIGRLLDTDRARLAAGSGADNGHAASAMVGRMQLGQHDALTLTRWALEIGRWGTEAEGHSWAPACKALLAWSKERRTEAASQAQAKLALAQAQKAARETKLAGAPVLSTQSSGSRVSAATRLALNRSRA
jgi:hypothetical protein